MAIAEILRINRPPEARWKAALFWFGIFVGVAIASLWHSAIGLVVIGAWIAVTGAYAIASAANGDSKPDDDRCDWARGVLAASLLEDGTATSVEWLSLLGASFLAMLGPPLDAIIQATPFLLFAMLVVVACAFTQSLFHRHLARKVLRATA